MLAGKQKLMFGRIVLASLLHQGPIGAPTDSAGTRAPVLLATLSAGARVLLMALLAR